MCDCCPLVLGGVIYVCGEHVWRGRRMCQEGRWGVVLGLCVGAGMHALQLPIAATAPAGLSLCMHVFLAAE